GTVCVVGKMRDLILQLSKSSIYSTKPLLTRQGDDRYQFRDKSGTITAIIPVAAFNEQHVEPDDLVSINGSLDRKMTPPVVRIDRLLKQSPK
ncbi:NirD/YgiW/YdeI family stress tolerance protein, partial [Klebsiella quasipneumoniae]|uniref:NirD/YgiW/YdeI family stress tolerance protein n=1 Tax=Klebsiella quasipneumoniae TaxID=1463165 RepID=UPI003983B4EE